MSQSFQPRMQNVGQKNTPITKIPTATVPFSQGLSVEQVLEMKAENVEPSVDESEGVSTTGAEVKSETDENTKETEQQETEIEQNVPEIKVPDFTYGRSLSTSFCMRCGGQAEYFGKSTKLNFSKKLCGDCVAYYATLLNV